VGLYEPSALVYPQLGSMTIGERKTNYQAEKQGPHLSAQQQREKMGWRIGLRRGRSPASLRGDMGIQRGERRIKHFRKGRGGKVSPGLGGRGLINVYVLLTIGQEGGG